MSNKKKSKVFKLKRNFNYGGYDRSLYLVIQSQKMIKWCKNMLWQCHSCAILLLMAKHSYTYTYTYAYTNTYTIKIDQTRTM